jgi:hypothetical protein
LLALYIFLNTTKALSFIKRKKEDYKLQIQGGLKAGTASSKQKHPSTWQQQHQTRTEKKPTTGIELRELQVDKFLGETALVTPIARV